MLSSHAKRELKINQRRILIDSIEIGIPSSQQILSWAERRLPNGKKVGEIKNSKTVNYKKFTPLLDGLFCERIFGPVKSLVCACGKKQPDKNMLFCEKCEVEYTDQSVRRYRLGYIPLLSSVAHIWYLKGRPSYLSVFLGKRKKTVLGLAYCNAYLIEQAFAPINDITDAERRQNHGLQLYSKSVKSFTRTRQFAANFYKSGKLRSKVEVQLLPEKNVFSSKAKYESKKANFISRIENKNFSPANLQGKNKTPILNSFLYLLTHLLKTSQINSTTSINYAHYLNSVKESNKSIVKRKVATILRKEEEKENQRRFKRCLQLVPNTLINLKKQDREIDPDNLSKSQKITLFSPDTLLANRDQAQDIKYKSIPIPSVPRTLGRKGSTINRKLFVQSLSANRESTVQQGLGLYTPEARCDNLQPDSRIGRVIANLRATNQEKGNTESNNELKKINQRNSQKESIELTEKNEKFKAGQLEENVFPTKDKLVCLLANTPEKARNLYRRNQSLPFLPTLVCKYNLRDELLNIFNSSPLNEDIPIPLYCESKRWEPLQDVHKFMAEQSFSEINNLNNFLSPQTNSSLDVKTFTDEEVLPKVNSFDVKTFPPFKPTDRTKNSSSPTLTNLLPITSESEKLEEILLPSIPTSGASTTFRSRPESREESARRENVAGVIKVKFVRKQEDIKSLRHILYKTFLKKSSLTIFNQSREKVSEWGVSRFADSKLILNPYSSEATVRVPLFNRKFVSEKENYSDKSVRTIQSYWKNNLLRNKERSVSTYLNEKKQVKKTFHLNNSEKIAQPESFKKINRRREKVESIKLKGLASHLKSNLEKKVNKSNTFSDLLLQNPEYTSNQLNLLKQSLEYDNTSQRYLTDLDEYTFKKGNTSNKSTFNDHKDILIKLTGIAKEKVYFFEKRLINTVYNSLVKKDLLFSNTPFDTLKSSGIGEVVRSVTFSEVDVKSQKSQPPFHVLTSTSEKRENASTGINASLAPFLILPERIGVVDSLRFHSLDVKTFQENLLSSSKRGKKDPEFAKDQVELLGEKPNNFESLEESQSRLADFFTSNEEKLKKKLQEGEIKNSTTLQVQLPNGISQFLAFKTNSLSKVKESAPENLSTYSSNSSNLSSKAFEFLQGKSKPKLFKSKQKDILSQLELTAIREILSYTGGGALKQLLQRFDPQLLSTYLLTDMQITREAYTSRERGRFAEDLDIKRKILTGLSRRIYRNARRLKIANLLTRSNRRPEWMMISTLPVLPPDLRPILQMSENLVVTSDLNSLYQRVIYRNNRYYKLRLIDFHLVTAMQRLVQDAVDRLIENGKGGSKPFYTPSGRPLKSLSDTLKGKKGRFRLNLLGKRVDFSGRSVIVVSPHLKIHECGLPKEIALKLYTYFLLRQFLLKKQASSIVIAKKMIKQRKSSMWNMLRDIIYYHPLLLNRAPTLHRLGIQAFQPRLVNGSAILLHPLVCSGFNADFDGDQMGVHLPLSFSARAEAWDLLWSRNNLLSPATGQPVLLPSQDMVLGFYYMTQSFPARSLRMRKESQLGKSNSSSRAKRLHSPKNLLPSTSREKKVVPGTFIDTRYDRVPDRRKLDFSTRLFSNYLDLTRAFQNGDITLHTPIWLKWHGKVENDSGVSVPLELRLNTFGSSTYIYSKYKRRNDEQLSYLKGSEENTSFSTIYTRTTVGRVLVNEIIFSSRQIR